jgi:hypothetical protein
MAARIARDGSFRPHHVGVHGAGHDEAQSDRRRRGHGGHPDAHDQAGAAQKLGGPDEAEAPPGSAGGRTRR